MVKLHQLCSEIALFLPLQQKKGKKNYNEKNPEDKNVKSGMRNPFDFLPGLGRIHEKKKH